jgi:hypothetical protein
MNQMEKESNKMTAVEWVLQYLNNVKPNEFCSIEKIKELLEQAKEMEKEQIINAFWDGGANWDSEKTAEQHYNEEYGGNNEQQ